MPRSKAPQRVLKKLTLVERHFQPAVTEAQRILDEAELPDVDHYVRLRPDRTIKDDLPAHRPWLALRARETAIAGVHVAELRHGTDSEEHYAARVVSEFRILQRAIHRTSDPEMPLYLAVRLQELVSEWEMSPEMRSQTRRERALRQHNLTAQERATRARAFICDRARMIRERNPDEHIGLSDLARRVLSLGKTCEDGTPLPRFERVRHILAEEGF
jgi:hypothetical protein